MDDVFKALADPGRRRLMDELFERDGQTLGEMCEHLPGMTRFGVMNHLKVLEAAGLVATRKVGRNKHHYLNPVPIQQMHDRWIAKYAEVRTDRMAAIKRSAEHSPGGPMTTTDTPVHVYEIFVNAPAERVWQAIVDGDLTEQYFYGTRVESTWEPGAEIVYLFPDGRRASEGEILSIDEGKQVEMTFRPLWDPALTEEGWAREIWRIDDQGAMCKLACEIYDIEPNGAIHRDFAPGLVYILSGLKTVVETGSPLGAPGPSGED